MKIGWIGLGKMGLPMATRIAAAGHPVTVYVRNEAGRDRAGAAGFAVADSLARTVEAADVVVSAISDDAALGAVFSGGEGLAAHLTAGQTVIETSTVSPDASAAVAEQLASRSVAYLRAPVSGSTALAAAGTLTVMVSGPRAAYAAMEPILSAFARKSFFVGEGEEARIVKLVVNTLVAATSALLAEALAFGRKGGLDAASALEVIGQSAVASPLIEYKRKLILDGTFDANFSVAQMMKDLDIVLGVGRANHVPMPLAAMIREQYEAAFVNGKGERDFFVLVQEMAARAGIPD